MGLTPERVVAAAIEVVAEHGAGGLSLGAVAKQLGVQPPSLYNHVAGRDDLRRRVAIAAIDQLAEALGSAVMGRSGDDAIHHLAVAYRQFASSHPGLYAMTQEANPRDEERAAAGQRAIEPALAALAGYGIVGDDAIHATRALRSALHGFVMLEISGGFGLDLDVNESFDRIVALLVATLSRPGADRGAVPG